MVLDNAFKILSTPKYLLIWGISTALLMWIYMGVLTNHAMYDTMGWIFALAFPPLVSGVTAAQWYNLAERKACPVTAMSGGALESLLGIITVACPVCPAILLGWLGLAAAIPGRYWPDLGLNSQV